MVTCQAGNLIGEAVCAGIERGREMRLDKGDHRLLAIWAADCAEHVLPYFEEKYPGDHRPRTAIEAGRAWVRGEIAMSEARAAAVATHAAARAAGERAARAAARAAGHAAGTAHMAGHARHAAVYAVKAATYAAAPTDAAAGAGTERDWQYRRLSEHLRPLAFFDRTDDVVLRPATSGDAGAIADVYLASFHATYDFPLAHKDDQVRRWIADILVPALEVWVAATRARTIVALMALTEDMLDQLYVVPGWTSRGIGGRLVALAKTRRPGGLDLYTFQVNPNARSFYEHRGFLQVSTGDGSGNEEGQPDVRYAWRPTTS